MLKDLNKDFQDLINYLTSRNVEFLVVGAHALAFHGIARYTNDIGLWIKRSEENAERVGLALDDFGVSISQADARSFAADRKIIRLGQEPHQIDILNFVDGCDFDVAAARASHEQLGNVDVAILGLEDYVATKRMSGRPKDLSDLELLRSTIGPLPGDV